MTTFQTAAGATVTTSSRTNGFNQPVHVYECDGCDGIRGYRAPGDAVAGAEDHAKRCTKQQAKGGAS